MRIASLVCARALLAVAKKRAQWYSQLPLWQSAKCEAIVSRLTHGRTSFPRVLLREVRCVATVCTQWRLPWSIDVARSHVTMSASVRHLPAITCLYFRFPLPIFKIAFAEPHFHLYRNIYPRLSHGLRITASLRPHHNPQTAPQIHLYPNPRFPLASQTVSPPLETYLPDHLAHQRSSHLSAQPEPALRIRPSRLWLPCHQAPLWRGHRRRHNLSHQLALQPRDTRRWRDAGL